MKIYVGSSRRAQEKGNIATTAEYFFFWFLFVRFLFVLSELQIVVVEGPEWMREREWSQTLSKPAMDGQEETKNRGERGK